MTQSAPDKEKALHFEVLDGDIGLITFDTPNSRANTLSQATVGEMEALFAEVAKNDKLKGLIFRSAKPGMYIAGADLNELGAAENDPEQARKLVQRGLDMVAKVEAMPFPTVAVIDGGCMGGGLELSLGFDYRLAGTHPKVDIGLPEVKIGLIPGWGGTQRLTRVIGPALAAELICAGDSAKADKAKKLGIVFDVVPSDDLIDEAKRLMDWSREAKDWENVRKIKRQPVGLSEDQLSFTYAVSKAMVLSKTKGQVPAPLAALDAIINGCNLPLDEGLKVETDLFIPLVGSPISKNLIAVFFMDQKLKKDTGVADKSVEAKPVSSVGVIGAGIMGAGIAGAHVRRGVPAVMLDKFPEALAKGAGNIANMMESRVKIGRMSQEDLLTAMAKLNTTSNYATLGDKDVIIEAIIENEEAKVSLFKEIESIARDDAIIASNTSTISITRMAASLKNPQRFAGMHFFNPVDRMLLVEVIRGEKTDDQTVATLVALAKKISKTPIVVKDCPGFLVNRILFPYLNEALVLLEEGAEPRAIDKAATEFGMPMGPITLQDLVGLDTSLFAGKVINTAFADRAVDIKILEELVNAGRLGKKSGAGFYNYDKGSRGKDDPVFAEMLAKCRKGTRDIDRTEIQDRLFLPMLVEASRVMMEEIVRTPADADMGLIMGIGFPVWRGGLLRWADSLGIASVLDKLSKYESLGLRYHPTELLKQLAGDNKGFYG